MEDLLNKWMRAALLEASKALLHDDVPVGAVLVHENKMVGLGHNQRESINRTTAHAEIMALEAHNRRYSQWRLPSGTSLFVTAEPCLMCAGALLSARIEHIFYGC